VHTSVESFVTLLRNSSLLDAHQVNEIIAWLPAGGIPPSRLAKQLVRRGYLTVYQATQLFRDEGEELCLGRYRVLEPLGGGGACQVFKAIDTRRWSLVALKVVRPEHRTDDELMCRFEREVDAISRLSHPNLVRAQSAKEDAGPYYFAVEYVVGIDLFKLVRLSGPLPVGRACDFTSQAACGLEHAHEHGLVHRDVKPSNLLLADGTSCIKVVDLGLARFVDDGGEILTRGTIGSPDYLAPEQGRDSHGVDARADVYSLGATLYYLLTGKAPFADAKSLAQKLIWLQTEEPPKLSTLRPELPANLIAVIERMMAKNPDERYQTAFDVALALEPWAEKSSEAAWVATGADTDTRVELPMDRVREAMTAAGQAKNAPSSDATPRHMGARPAPVPASERPTLLARPTAVPVAAESETESGSLDRWCAWLLVAAVAWLGAMGAIWFFWIQ
jgi:serine/threonine-protein kinase